MNFDELLNNKKIEKVNKTDCNFEQPLRDINFAKRGLKFGNYGRIMAIGYDAVLMTGNALMNFLGYRAIGKDHHKNVFEFLRLCEINSELAEYFNKIRVKRNNFVYRGEYEVKKGEAEEIIEKAEEFVHEIRTFVQENRTEELS